MVQGIGNGNYTNPYDRNREKLKKAATSQETPAFLLGDEEGVIWEPSNEKNKDKSKKDAKTAKTAEPEKSQPHLTKTGIGSTQNNAAEQKKDAAASRAQKQGEGLAFLQGALEFGRRLLRKLANFFWYGEENSAEEQMLQKEGAPSAGVEVLQKQAAGESSGQSLQGKAAGESSGQSLQGQEAGATSGHGLQKQAAGATSEQGAQPPFDRLTREQRIQELLAKKDQDGLMDLLTEHHTKHLALNSDLLTRYDKRGQVVSQGEQQNRILRMDRNQKTMDLQLTKMQQKWISNPA